MSENKVMIKPTYIGFMDRLLDKMMMALLVCSDVLDDKLCLESDVQMNHAYSVAKSALDVFNKLSSLDMHQYRYVITFRSDGMADNQEFITTAVNEFEALDFAQVKLENQNFIGIRFVSIKRDFEPTEVE